jgi:hypothetical protein
VHEFDKVKKEVDEMRKRPTQIRTLSDVCSRYIASWDYYLTRADFEAGRPVTLDRDFLAQHADFAILQKVAFDLLEFYGLKESEAGVQEKKESSDNSQNSSQTPMQELETYRATMPALS